GDTYGDTYTEKVNLEDSSGEDLRMYIAKQFQIKDGFNLTKNAFFTIQNVSADFEFAANKKFKFTAPLIDFGNSKIQNIRNINNHQTYWNGTGQADFRGVTSNTDPLNIN